MYNNGKLYDIKKIKGELCIYFAKQYDKENGIKKKIKKDV